MLEVDMLVWSNNLSQENPNTQEKMMIIQHMLNVNMLSWSNNSNQIDQDTEEKSYLFNTCCISTCLTTKIVYQCIG